MAGSIKKNDEYKRIYNIARSFANKNLVMYVEKLEGDTNNLGISVSKKVGNSVVRHRIKRVIKEIFRLNDGVFHSGWNIIVIARVGAKGKTYHELEESVMHLAKLHGLLDK